VFGLGYQELILVVIILGVALLLYPAVFYLFVLIGVKVSRSPRLALLALWIIGACYVLVQAGGVNIEAVIEVVLVPIGLALQLVWLWLMGCLWQRVGLSRLGNAWRSMASLCFNALRGGREEKPA
jgi:hypothetical protein